MRGFVAAIVIVGFFGTSVDTAAQMSSSNYEIRWDTIGNGGDDTGSSASYILRDTAGNMGVGGSESDSYQLGAGYRSGVFDQVIEFSFFSQDNDTETAATALVGQTITCDPTDFGVGDMVALVQDFGESQVSAIGQVVSVGADSITVDELSDGGTAPVIDGAGDVVYVLAGTSADFGTLSTNLVRTAIIGFAASADVDGGYVVQAVADGALRDGAEEISAVSDGSVTEGFEEYGARSSDASLAGSTFDSVDTALTTSFQDIADSSSPVLGERNFLTLKASVASGTDGGSYAQTLTLIISGNF